MDAKQHVFGPVPSRRLGFSLGIDISPVKACSFDCIYCEAGCTTHKTGLRQPWYEPETVITQIRERLASCPAPDCITFSGSGEPTLNSGLGAIIRGIKNLTGLPVAVITNSSLLFMDDVRRDLAPVDILLPTLVDTQSGSFGRIHRPTAELDPADIRRGLVGLRDWFRGLIRLEAMIMEGINDSDAEVASMARLAELVRPDIIDINTLVRPAPTSLARAVPEARLKEIAKAFGPKAEIIAPFSKSPSRPEGAGEIERIITGIARIRPLTAEDIARVTGLNPEAAAQTIRDMVSGGRLKARAQAGKVFYTAAP